MERTEHREQFFAHAMNDPYTHILMNQWADAWVLGYEAAMKEFVDQLKTAGEERAALDTWNHFHEKSRSEWRTDALALLTEQKSKSEAEAMIALATLGPLLPKDFGGS